jgi:6-phosphofructokinase 1
LTGASILKKEWSGHVNSLKEDGEVSAEAAEKCKTLYITGMVGSIDNDTYGTDMTIGADSALHRITEAVDAIISTAASHQRTFVVEVMGRNCGYLALMSAMACSADWVFIPENPPKKGAWEDQMCDLLKAGRKAGRRDSIVIMAEGARDDEGNPIESAHVKRVLEEKLGEDTRITVLGHVQRGGSPSAYDRIITTLLGHKAVEIITDSEVDSDPLMVGVNENQLISVPLIPTIEKTRKIKDLIKEKKYQTVMKMRGGGFQEAWDTLKVQIRSLPKQNKPIDNPLRIGILHSGGPAPGMNAAVLTACRMILDHGHIPLAIKDGFRGLIKGKIEEFNWMSVGGWTTIGGAEIGTNRSTPGSENFYAIARQIEEQNIDALLMIGGWSGYEGIHNLYRARKQFPAFQIPMVCLPATINNNLPGSERSVGSDTALNNIVQFTDKIKQSAVASKRCFVVELMGKYCGYLSLFGGIATGAEKVYLHEEGVKLSDLQKDLDMLVEGFSSGKRLGLMIRNEKVNELYTTRFMAALFEEEGGDIFDVRQAIPGHIQQGGDPSPFDRILAIRMAKSCVEHLIESCQAGKKKATFITMEHNNFAFTSMSRWEESVDEDFQRPVDQWWMELRHVAKLMSHPPESMDK